nr:MAG TPA: hypothetical protein [Caudoviricetes sp.]
MGVDTKNWDLRSVSNYQKLTLSNYQKLIPSKL